MAEPVLGSSLLQARDVHRHASPHNRNNYNHIRSHQRLHQRQEESSDSTVEVVKTVAVVQIVDATGSLVTVSTQTSDPSTVVPTQSEVTFVAASNPDIVTAIADDVSSLVQSLETTSTSLSVDTTASSMPSSFPTVESFASITSAPSSGSTAYPTFSGVTNSTKAASTSSLFRNETAIAFKSLVATNLTTSTLPSSSGTILFNASYTTTLGQSSTPVSVTLTTTTASEIGDGSFSNGSGTGGIAGGATATGSSSATSTPDAGSGTTPTATPPTTVAVSVLGAVAGVAFVLVIALYLLRWKKRQNGMRLRDSEGPAGSGRLITAGPSSGGPRGMGEMSQRRSIPFAIPGALASLTGYKGFSQQRRDPSPESGAERSFQKISGRKLPSVLQHGGDGYSAPTDVRDSILSDGSHYRDSQGGYFGGPNMPRLALGSPMRPESGVPIFHAGPARTPVTEQGHFSLEDPFRDPVGRTLASLDGSSRSHGSGSRFTEVI